MSVEIGNVRVEGEWGGSWLVHTETVGLLPRPRRRGGRVRGEAHTGSAAPLRVRAARDRRAASQKRLNPTTRPNAPTVRRAEGVTKR